MLALFDLLARCLGCLLSFLFGLLLQRGFRFPDLLETILAPRQLLWQFIAAISLAKLRVLVALLALIGATGACIGRSFYTGGFYLI